MKLYLASMALILVLSASSCDNNTQKISSNLIVIPETASGKQTDKYPVMAFEKTSHDFGEIIKGEKVSYRFVFKNTGKIPLIITDVPSSCGCTVPEFSKLPVLPGEEGYVTVTFNSQTESGFRQKTVTVVSNAQPRMQTLTISAQVVSIYQ